MAVEWMSILFTEKSDRCSERVILAQNAGRGAGPKNNRSAFSLPMNAGLPAAPLPFAGAEFRPMGWRTASSSV
jgi:hypothetical protein